MTTKTPISSPTPHCIACGSSRVVKFGMVNGTQRYKCQVCDKTMLITRVRRLANKVALKMLCEVVDIDTVKWFCNRALSRPRIFYAPARESLNEESKALDTLLAVALTETKEFDDIRWFQLPMVDKKEVYEKFVHAVRKRLPADHVFEVAHIDAFEPKVTKRGNEILAIYKPDTSTADKTA